MQAKQICLKTGFVQWTTRQQFLIQFNVFILLSLGEILGLDQGHIAHPQQNPASWLPVVFLVHHIRNRFLMELRKSCGSLWWKGIIREIGQVTCFQLTLKAPSTVLSNQQASVNFSSISLQSGRIVKIVYINE